MTLDDKLYGHFENGSGAKGCERWAQSTIGSVGGEKSFLLISFVYADFEKPEWDSQAGTGGGREGWLSPVLVDPPQSCQISPLL